MAKGYKLDISDYIFDSFEINKDTGTRSMVPTKVEMRYELPVLFGSPGLSKQDGGKKFDLNKIGVVCLKIQACKDDSIVLDRPEFEAMKERAEELGPFLGLIYAKLLDRVIKAPEIELTEAKAE